jgi:hypothetical protein
LKIFGFVQTHAMSFISLLHQFTYIFLGKAFFHLLTFCCKTFFQIVPETVLVVKRCLSNVDSATLKYNYLSAYVVILGLRDCELLGLRDTTEWALAHHLTWRRKGNWSPNFAFISLCFWNAVRSAESKTQAVWNEEACCHVSGQFGRIVSEYRIFRYGESKC